MTMAGSDSLPAIVMRQPACAACHARACAAPSHLEPHVRACGQPHRRLPAGPGQSAPEAAAAAPHDPLLPHPVRRARRPARSRSPGPRTRTARAAAFRARQDDAVDAQSRRGPRPDLRRPRRRPAPRRRARARPPRVPTTGSSAAGRRVVRLSRGSAAVSSTATFWATERCSGRPGCCLSRLPAVLGRLGGVHDDPARASDAGDEVEQGLRRRCREAVRGGIDEEKCVHAPKDPTNRVAGASTAFATVTA